MKSVRLQEWATQITSLRDRLGINQAELARKMECSAMTVSRWERGLLQPSAQHFVRLGNLGNKNEAWFFWEKAGIQASKMVSALSGSTRAKVSLQRPRLDSARAGAHAIRLDGDQSFVRLPLLKAVAGTHGVQGDRRSSLRHIPATEMVGAPLLWCPNPAYTSLLRVKGHSMEPLVRNGDIVSVDSFQTDQEDLFDKVIIAANDQKGLCVSRLRRYDRLAILEAENREYHSIVLNKASGWRIVGKVLWWISVAP
jgi:phage repressor protein C with HTH and peptisase S24 domain